VAAQLTVIPGFSGDLVSHAYLEQQLLAAAGRRLPVPERPLARWWRQVTRALGPASSARSVLDVGLAPLLECLGHERPTAAPHGVGLVGSLRPSGAVVIALPWAVPVRAAWREAATRGVAAGAAWALVSNGRSLRIVDCTRTWSRAGVQFDFELLLSTATGAAALWMLAGANALGGTGPGSLRGYVAASDLHASTVCRSLGDGVLDAWPRLAAALARTTRRRDQARALDQALTLIYRILFLLFAEARGAVPVWHEWYRDSYTIDALAGRAVLGPAPGLWAGLQAISRLAHAGCRAGDLDVTAFNGRLFAPHHAPLAEQRRVPDAVVRDVLLALATEPGRGGRRRISYHDLGVEQLGSVYERVLEHEPAERGATLTLARTSTERKATGSFYTPRSITEFLVRRTLAPLVEGRTSDAILDLRVLDPAMGSGAFLVAAGMFLAEHAEQALVREGRWTAADITAAERAALLRQVAERCLFGVDLNPTAVQLARLSMWLTTLAAGRPLTFLDHHLCAGNSLLGARLADLARPPRQRSRGAVSLPLLDDQLAPLVAAHILPARLQLALRPSDTAETVRDKERALAALTAPGGTLAQWSLAADAWCGAALGTPTPPAGLVGEWIAAATGAATTVPAAPLRASLGAAQALAREHGAFHWELAFPEVFFDHAGHLRPDGGFDAVLGNPPWDMLRADTGSARDRAAARAATDAALRFYRSSGIYRLNGAGHANRYQLFLERALHLTRPGGRIGLVLPAGLATDHGCAALRRHLFDTTTVDTWLGFDNRRRLFPIHRSIRFVLLGCTHAGRTDRLTFRTGLTDAADLDDDRRGPPLAITRARLEAWSPGQLSVPEVPDATALAILSGISQRVPPLADASGWGMRFGRELNATEDRGHFVPRAWPPGAPAPAHLLPIVEGKLLSPFQVALDRTAVAIARKAAAGLAGADAGRHPRIAYRDVASATNRLTLIAAILPAGTISTHTVFVSKRALDEPSTWCLLGLLNSLVANYLVRRHVTTHVTTALMSRLPVPRPAPGSPAFARMAALSHSLAVTGIEAGAGAYAELNAMAADLYGLTDAQYEYIVATFPLIPESIRAACLSRRMRLR
jgi:hypothetical protein